MPDTRIVTYKDVDDPIFFVIEATPIALPYSREPSGDYHVVAVRPSSQAHDGKLQPLLRKIGEVVSADGEQVDDIMGHVGRVECVLHFDDPAYVPKHWDRVRVRLEFNRLEPLKPTEGEDSAAHRQG
jgi:hypothetical protein